MKTEVFFFYLAVMAGVTYLIRAIPFVLCEKQIKNRFVRSFLEYIPYAVLGAMTFPQIFYSANGTIPAIAGTITGLVLSYCEQGLVTVALASCAVVFGMKLFGF